MNNMTSWFFQPLLGCRVTTEIYCPIYRINTEVSGRLCWESELLLGRWWISYWILISSILVRCSILLTFVLKDKQLRSDMFIVLLKLTHQNNTGRFFQMTDSFKKSSYQKFSDQIMTAEFFKLVEFLLGWNVSLKIEIS